MTRGVCVVAALVAGMFLDGGRVATAQVVAAENRPYMYMWGAPGPWGPGLEQNVSQMVRWYVDVGDAAAVAAKIKTLANDQINLYQTTDPGHVCVLLQNFGQWLNPSGPPSPAQVSLIDEDDDVFVPQWFNGQTPTNFRYLQSSQPWVEAGRLKVKAWMTAFLAAYTGPTPQRFHFDSEIYFGTCCDANATRVMIAVAKDPRWHTVRVPGSKDYLVPSATDKTMEEMWQEALQRFDWGTPIPNPKLEDLLDEFEGTQHVNNRKYALWYGEITKRAVDAAMHECAYDLIKLKWPNCKVSNYEHMDVDGKGETFGWFTGRDNTGAPVVGQPPPQVPLRKSIRGMVDFTSIAGSQHFWSDFIERDTQQPQPYPEVRRSVWAVYPSATKADFSSPVLYSVHSDQYGPTSGRKEYYLPTTPPYTPAGQTPGWQPITGGQAALQNARRTVESILNTLPYPDPASIVPWVEPVNEFIQWSPSDIGYYWGQDDLRDMLAMLRAKKNAELILWWGDTPGSYPDWGLLMDIMERVYVPQLNLIRITSGTWTLANKPYPTATVPPVDRLRYTLRVPGDEKEEIVDLESVDVGGVQQIALTFRFGSLQPLAADTSKVTLNLECDVDPNLGPISGIRGKVYVWDWTNSSWRLQLMNDFQDPIDTGFGFFAPRNDASPNLNYYELRRCFANLEKFISPPSANGPSESMDVKIVLQQTLTNDPFKARVDLVQLLGEPEIVYSTAAESQGADFNHSQSTESYDAAAFMAAYAAGAEAADFNNDGIVNTDDLTAFNAAFVAGPP